MASSANNKQDIVIIKYNAGNIQSVLYAFERIGVSAEVSDDHDRIRNAGKVVFPGVGEASSAMNYLRERGLDQLIKDLKQPVLGICLGMQLMCAHTEENDTTCLGIFGENVKLFKPGPNKEKVPQIGWNNIFHLKTDLFNGVPEQSYIYSVHSFYASEGSETIATADYIHPYSAALHKANFYGVQFHPEKSAAVGEQILKNFFAIDPEPLQRTASR
ncbi:MAG: imidazole glycerol phosphate synthase subunit HisH [Chitinophagaceae bacterium]|nr:imidazole glycerol phosphate synthase subunit HisH [Chitinophagaceae bacterium]